VSNDSLFNREKNKHMHMMRWYAILFPPFKHALVPMLLDTTFLFSFFLLPQRRHFLTFSFSLINAFFPILLRQRCKNTYRTKEKRTSYSFYFMSSMFFCCVLYIYLGSLLVTHIYIQTHTHTLTEKN